MPDPAVVVAIREFKQGLLAREDTQMQEMARRWLDVEGALEAQISVLADDLARMREAGEAIGESKLYRLERYKRLLYQTRGEFQRYRDYADRTLTAYQEGSLKLGLEHSAEAIRLSYWPGVGAYFDRLPAEAIENIVGIAGDGKPLGDLLKRRMIHDEDGTELAGAWQRLTSTLINGTAQGRNPRDVARDMRDDLSEGLNKALVIARTEGLRPYREASRSQYEHSGVVEGQKRLCAHDNRVCAACIADEGTLYSLHAIISDHPQGRCTSVPVVKGMPKVRWLSGETWFSDQPEEVQLSILGRGRWEAWKAKEFSFRDLIVQTEHPVWGAGLRPARLSELRKGSAGTGSGYPRGQPPPQPSRPPSEQEIGLQAEIDEIKELVDEMIAEGDPTGGGLKSYLDNLQQSLKEEQSANEALWEKLGLTPDEATADDWLRVADELAAEGYALYKKYTKEGIQLDVARQRGAKASGYMVVGKEVVLVRRGAFSRRQAQRMEGELWADAKGDLSEAMGQLLQRAGFSPDDIAQADYYQRLRLMEELGQKEVLKTRSGRVSQIDRVPQDARAEVVDAVDFDLAAICANTAIDPLSVPTLDAYGKMELADMIRTTKAGVAQQEGSISELNF